MENENIILALKNRKEKIISEKNMLEIEMKKIQEILSFYESHSVHDANSKTTNGHALLKEPKKTQYNRNGNTQKVITKARELIQEKNRAVTTQEIADSLIAEGFPADHYSSGLSVQIAGYLSRKRNEFQSTSKGWELRNQQNTSRLMVVGATG